jgi:hypothetical protein
MATELWQIQPRELSEHFLRGRMKAMNLLDQDEAACKVRRLASRTIPTPPCQDAETEDGI